MERAALGLSPRASHPADQEPNDARQGGDRPSSTDLELPLYSHQPISNPIVHSMRATSCRTSPLQSSGAGADARSKLREQRRTPTLATGRKRSSATLMNDRCPRIRNVAIAIARPAPARGQKRSRRAEAARFDLADSRSSPVLPVRRRPASNYMAVHLPAPENDASGVPGSRVPLVSQSRRLGDGMGRRPLLAVAW